MNSNIRVLYVNYSLDVGGIETLILELSKRLDRDKFSAAVCAFVENGKLEAEFKKNKIPVFIIKKKKGLDIGLSLRLARFLQAEKFDIMHTHNQTAWLYGAVAALLVKMPLVHTNHTTADYHNYHVRRWKKIEFFLALITRCITVVAKSVADFMIQEGISLKKIEVIHNGIDFSRYALEGSGSTKKGELKFQKDEPIVGNVARLFPNKNHGTLIRAFKEVLKEIPLAKLVLVGDGPLRAELSAQIEDLQLVKNVFLLGNRRDVPELLHVFDVFVLPSLREGLPIVLLEAMAAGIPVIASDVDGNTELVIENKTGLIVPPHDIFALAGAIVRMLRDKQSAKLMSSAAKEMVIKDFSFETMVKKYETLYWNNAKA